MHHAFISYSRRDRAYVAEVAARLREEGVPIWMDDRDIPVSVPWFTEIQQAIRAARLMVIFESFSWHESQACVVEAQEADRLAVPHLFLPISGDAAHAAEAVKRAMAEVGPGQRERTELLVLSQSWASQGRPRAALLGGRALKRLAGTALPVDSQEAHVAARFLGESRSRARRKRVFGLVLTAVVAVSIPAFLGLRTQQNQVRADAQAEQQAFMTARVIRDMSEVSPYEAMRLAIATLPRERVPLAELMRTDSDSVGSVLAAAPRSADSFWARNNLVMALSVRVPDSVESGRPPEPARRAGDLVEDKNASGLNVSAVVGGARVVVADSASGRLLRELTAAGGISDVALAPDGRTAAVAVDQRVQRVNLATGMPIQTLLGATSALRAVEFAPDGSSLTAWDAEGHALSWRLGPGRTIESAPSRWYMGAVTAKGRPGVVLLSRDGRVDLVDVDEARIERSWSVDGGPTSRIAAGAGGMVAVLSTQDESPVALIDLAEPGVRRLSAPGCTPKDLAFDDGSDRLLLACQEGVAFLDQLSGRLTRPSLQLPGGTLAIADAGEQIVVVNGYSELLVFDESGRSVLNNRTRNCMGSALWLATDPEGRYVFHAGSGSGLPSCSNRFAIEDQEITGTAFMGDAPGYTSEAVAVSSDGTKAAFGYSDGSVMLVGVEGLDRLDVLSGFLGTVRGVAFDSDSENLVVATRDGQAVVVDPPLAGLDGQRLVEEARDRIAQALSWGLISE